MNIQQIKQRYGIVGSSILLERALRTAMKVAPTELTVLITGKSGVGKEVFSKIIHNLSPRKHNAFIAINCGAIPPGTINSELFGHEKGAFTGANIERQGYFESVNKGTIFLDEIGEMPLDTQSHLLRILESGEYIRVGSSKIRKTDVRVIAATNIDLLDNVHNGKFREDLYYRLNIVPIHVPSLRERKEDILILFRKFVMDFSDKYNATPVRLDEEAAELLVNYSWPGNIRQLKNISEQLCIMSDNETIHSEDLLTVLPNIRQRNLPSIPEMRGAREMQDKELLYKVMFELKRDMSSLKGMLMQLVKENNLRFPKVNEPGGYAQESYADSFLQSSGAFSKDAAISEHERYADVIPTDPNILPTNATPIVIHPTDGDVSTEEEFLSLEDMEKKMIVRALEKYNGRRKEASVELGISERTLYRKIKQYEIGSYK